MRPSRCSGISECTMPRPAVIHCTAPGSSTPSLPWLSLWRMRPSSMYVTVSKPRCGCSGKSRDVVLGLVGAEFIEQQERVEIGQFRLADDARELDAGAVGGGLAAQRLDDRPRGGGERFRYSWVAYMESDSGKASAPLVALRHKSRSLGLGCLTPAGPAGLIRAPRSRALFEGYSNRGRVAQLVEQRIENPRVVGSIPTPATISTALVSLASR